MIIGDTEESSATAVEVEDGDGDGLFYFSLLSRWWWLEVKDEESQGKEHRIVA